MSPLDAAYFRGRQACADGKRQDANPHPPEAAEHGYWNRGWLEEFATLPEPLKARRLPEGEQHANQ